MKRVKRHTGDPSGGYDRLARAYIWLEVLAFSRTLMRARLAHLERLAVADRVLVVGEGDGHFLAGLYRSNNSCRVVCLERSGEMIARAKRRLGQAATRVRFVQEDVRTAVIEPQAFDLVVTHFVLDLFDPAELDRLVPKLAAALRPAGLWLAADFAVPDRPPARWRAQLWLAVMLAFFRWRTDLAVTRLHDPTPYLTAAGLTSLGLQRFQQGLVTSRLLTKRPHEPDSAASKKSLTGPNYSYSGSHNE